MWRAALLGRANGLPVATGYCVACLGHDTPEDAKLHYAQFLVESRTYFDKCDEAPCLLCAGESTSMAAYVYDETGQTQRIWPLCKEHREKQTLVAVICSLLGNIDRFQ